jgi:hypothetical protein
MTTFAHTYENSAEAFKNSAIYESAAFTLVLHRADGKIQTVDSNELPAYADSDRAIDAAMFAISDYDDSCDVYHFGEYYGTAEYVDTAREGSFFRSFQVMFSMPY